jgi:RimJ/RimL family protein N-acetyltransferase
MGSGTSHLSCWIPEASGCTVDCRFAPQQIIDIPSLQTERLELIPPDRRCDAAYQRFYTDAEASAAYGGPLTTSATWARLAFDVGAWTLQGFGVWAVRTRHDQEVIGVCGYW